MKVFGLAWVACVIGEIPLWAQSSPPAPQPQSARQALIEMFLGKGADDFAKHLPDEARQALIRKGDTPEVSVVLKIASIGREISRAGQRVETFDAGPNILIAEDDTNRQRIEIAIEHDSFLGEDDEIELSLHSYKDGEAEQLPIVPRFIFTMNQEKDVWRLKELTVAGHIPLTDPDYLRVLRRQQGESDENLARMRISIVAAAETTYATANPASGYSCDLSQLSDPGSGAQDWNGYRFALSGCEGAPSKKYRVLAVPLGADSEAKTFCSDESGKIRSLKGGTASKCYREGENVQTPQYAPTSEQ